jgi:hypothetical protein
VGRPRGWWLCGAKFRVPEGFGSDFAQGVVMFIQHQHEWSALLHHHEASVIVDPEGRQCRQLVVGDSALCFEVMRVVASPMIFFVQGKSSQAQLETLTLIGPNFGPHINAAIRLEDSHGKLQPRGQT